MDFHLDALVRQAVDAGAGPDLAEDAVALRLLSGLAVGALLDGIYQALERGIAALQAKEAPVDFRGPAAGFPDRGGLPAWDG